MIARVQRQVRVWMWLAACALPAALGAQSPGQVSESPPRADTLVTWSLEVPDRVRPGRPFDARLEATVTRGWKFYASEQTVQGPRPLGVAAADVAFLVEGQPVPDALATKVEDAIWSGPVAYHDRDTSFRVVLRPANGVKGPTSVRLTVRYQVCSDEVCLRPMQTTVAAPVIVR
jgi:hypothetical protein